MTTTLNAIKAHEPCPRGWAELLSHLGKTRADDEPLSITTILDSNGLNDALWALRAVVGHEREMRLFAVWCARLIAADTMDERCLHAISMAEARVNGMASEDDLHNAWIATEGTAHTSANHAGRSAAHPVAWVAAIDVAWYAALYDQKTRIEQRFREICSEVPA